MQCFRPEMIVYNVSSCTKVLFAWADYPWGDSIGSLVVTSAMNAYPCTCRRNFRLQNNVWHYWVGEMVHIIAVSWAAYSRPHDRKLIRLNGPPVNFCQWLCYLYHPWGMSHCVGEGILMKFGAFIEGEAERIVAKCWLFIRKSWYVRRCKRKEGIRMVAMIWWRSRSIDAWFTNLFANMLSFWQESNGS